MLNITLSREAVVKLQGLLAEEDSDDAVLRIREVKVGCGCKSHIALRLSIDEREDSDEEQEAVFVSMPFVVNNEVVDTYGDTYSITLNEDQFPIVTPVS